MADLRTVIISLVVLVVLVQSATQQKPPCPTYKFCTSAIIKTECEGSDQGNPCPGGRPSCYGKAMNDTCCCIQYNGFFKHLSEDAPKPPLDTTKLRIYASAFCPYAQRLLIITKAKNISTDVVYINPKNPPDWYRNDFAGKKSPLFETSEGVIPHSRIQSEYLDETYEKQNELYPNSTFLRANERFLIEKYDKGAGLLQYEILYGKGLINPWETPTLIQQFEDELIIFGDELNRRGTKFFGGEKPGMLDYMIWPWLERKPLIQMYYPFAYNYTETSVQMATWAEAMMQEEAVKTYAMSPFLHYEFTGSYRDRSPKFDLLAEA